MYLKHIIYKTLFHVGTCEVEYRTQTVRLSQSSKFKTSILSWAPSPPCDADRQRIQGWQSRDTRHQIFKSLDGAIVWAKRMIWNQDEPDQSSVERIQRYRMAESHHRPLSDLKASWWDARLLRHWQFDKIGTKIEHGRTRDTSFHKNNCYFDIQFLAYFSGCSMSELSSTPVSADFSSSPPKRTKIVLLGDQSVGKTSLITRCGGSPLELQSCC